MAVWFIKRPNSKEKRESFSIHRREHGKSPSIKDKRLDVINKRYRAGEDPDVCRRLTKELMVLLRDAERPKLTINDNLRVVERCWAKNPRRLNRDPHSAYRDLIRAAEACGQVLVEHGTREELQEQLDKAYGDTPNKHRRLVMGVNQLLRFLGKDFRIQGAKKEYPQVSYIGLVEFEARLLKVPQEYLRAFFGAKFATGCRTGELFALKGYGNNRVFIPMQRDKQFRLRPTKNNRQRNAVVIPELVKYVEAWVQIPDLVRQEHRRGYLKKQYSKWARELFGVTAHDLRHSYAIYLAECGLSVSEIASNIGDSEAVTRDHYQGFIKTDVQIDSMVSRLQKPPAKKTG